VRELGISLADLARRLGINLPGVEYAVQREEPVAHENGYQLTQHIFCLLRASPIYNKEDVKNLFHLEAFLAGMTAP
jgi:hypothetical protein